MSRSKRLRKRSLTVLSILTSVLMMTACASSTKQLQVPPQANLRQPCPPLPPLTDGQSKTIFRWALDYAIPMYAECANRVESLNEAK